MPAERQHQPDADTGDEQQDFEALKMAFEPTEFAKGSPAMVEDLSGAEWQPIFQNPCSFNPEVFSKVTMNFIRNPNLNTSWLFRADILTENEADHCDGSLDSDVPQPRIIQFKDYQLVKNLVRKLIPRNRLRDEPLDQTCLFYHTSGQDEAEKSMVVYKPHVFSETEIPFYHPKIRGLAMLHEWNASTKKGAVSIHYCFFDDISRSTKLVRTALNLLSMLHKHGEGSDYVKRVHHDTIVPQTSSQNTYTELKQKYARSLIDTWAEVTDPSKHVFEDLLIAAFLIELWRQMYQDVSFPGFVDIGCGNGLLVYILRQEGYTGWGFDARRRKSWDNYNQVSSNQGNTTSSLRQHILLPSIINYGVKASETGGQPSDDATEDLLHDGMFPKGTFIISNHADELTPWTPILARANDSPFIMIPCCSHNLSGARYRAPAPKGQVKSSSAYSSLVAWVSQIANDCGWEVETEMLRIPSTRNTGLLGRRRTEDYFSVNLQEVLKKYGGTAGYIENVTKLVRKDPRVH